MASSGIRRKVDDLGRVVIPAGMRRTLGIREGDTVEVVVEGERVVLAKPRDACVFCGREEEELTDFRGRLVCRDCLASLGSVDERLRATASARTPRGTDPDGRVADLPSWDAPSRPPAERPDTRDAPSPPPAGQPDTAPEPAAEEPADERPRDRPAKEPTRESSGEAPEEGPSRRPPYDPASTTAW